MPVKLVKKVKGQHAAGLRAAVRNPEELAVVLTSGLDPSNRGRRTPLGWVQKSNVLVPLVLLEGGRHLFTRDRLLLSPLFDSIFRTAAVDTLGAQLSAIAGWGPKLLARFLDETHREFRTRT